MESYGAANAGQLDKKFSKGPAPPRAGSHIGAILLNILLPPIVFAYVVSLLSFSPHFNYPGGVWWMVLPGILPILVCGRMWHRVSKSGGDTSWHAMSVFLLSFAFFAAAIFGDQNYWFALQQYYVPQSMKTYPNVDVSKVSGVQIMDAGRAYFAEGTRLDISKGMAFTHYDTYCVAPIVKANETLEFYDLWAVGINCCSTADPTFLCGDYGDGMARAGLRAVRDPEQLIWSNRGDERMFFRLAVQMAEAAFNIKTEHPIFFHWEKDPDRVVTGKFQLGYKLWILGMGAHFCVNTFIVIGFVTILPKSAKGGLRFVMGSLAFLVFCFLLSVI